MAEIARALRHHCDGCNRDFDDAADVAPAQIVQGTNPPQTRRGSLCRRCYVSVNGVTNPVSFEQAQELGA